LFEALNKSLTNRGNSGTIKNVYKLEAGIAWGDDLLTGNTLVDMQHQNIFVQVSNLARACEEGNDIGRLQDFLSFLFDYTIRHFTDEEALMLEYGYPGLERQINQHNEFKAKVSGLAQKFKESGSSAALSEDVSKIVVKWLVDHIKHEDKKISEYIRSVKVDGDGDEPN
jgi:hemerythrin